MNITRTQVEKMLLSRASKSMVFVGMDGTTNNGTNASLNEPIASALMLMGITPADVSLIADSDLATIDESEFLKLIDVAEVRLLENIQGNTDQVDVTMGDVTERLSQFTTALEKSIDRKQKQVQSKYGIGLGSLSAGVISMDFQTKHDDVEEADV